MKQHIVAQIRDMQAHDLIRVMVKSLRKPWTDVVSMETFGSYRGGLCFGCAATNTLCELAQDKLGPHDIPSDRRARKLGITERILYHIERAIDNLRQGQIDTYNACIEEVGGPRIDREWYRDWRLKHSLPLYLMDEYTEKHLKAFESLADYLEARTQGDTI